MSQRKKILIGAGVALVIVVFVILALRRQRGGGIEVRTEAVQHRDLVAVVSSSGRIRPHRSVDIQADVSGRIVELRVEEGNLVERGDTLLIIDRTAFEAAVQRARAQLSGARASATQARANRDQAHRSVERTRRLKEQNPELISDEQLEAAETNHDVQQALYEAAEHQVEQAQASLREAQDRLAKTVITAPMSGQVTRLNVDEGETAIVGTMNNPGTVLLTIGDLAEMEAVVEVDETDLPEIKLGDSTSVEIDAFPDRTFTGQVTRIGSSSIQGATGGLSGRTSDQSVDFEVVVRLDHPPPALRPDLSATAEIVTAQKDSVLSIPIIALSLKPIEEREEAPREREGRVIPLGEPEDADEREGVFVVQADHTVEFRPVQIGIAGRDHFEVLGGLQGEEVIVAGSYQAIRQLKDGSRVKITGGPEPGATASDDRTASADVIEASTGENASPAPSSAVDTGPEEVADAGAAAARPSEPEAGGAPADIARPYSVLVASFRSYEDALQRQRAWASPDIVVYVAPTLVDDEVYNRVFAGALGDRRAALDLMERLAGQGIKEAIRDWDVRPAGLAFLLGTFGSRRAAEEEAGSLLDRGIPAYVFPGVDTRGSTVFRVYAGGYERPEAARPLARRIDDAGLQAELVERVGPVSDDVGEDAEGRREVSEDE